MYICILWYFQTPNRTFKIYLKLRTAPEKQKLKSGKN